MRRIGIVAAGLAMVSSAGQSQGISGLTDHDTALADARRIATAALAGDAEAIIRRSDPKLIAEFGGQAELKAFIANLPVQSGKEVALDHERLRLGFRGMAYSRIVKMEKGVPMRVNLIFDPDNGAMTGLTVRPARDKGTHVPPRPAKTRLTLPFGVPHPGHAWTLSDGGSQVLDNYHARLDTYYAIDTSPRPLNTYTQPSSLYDAPCWDLPIKAAAPGTVMIARNGVVDNPKPGVNSNEAGGPGNHVILDHHNGEYTLYAHLRQGSIRVKPGQKVLGRQEIGRCGNSGSSTAPHLHFQLMDGPDLNTAQGIPPIFHDYFAGRRYVQQGTLTGGDVVLPAPRISGATTE